MMAWGRLLIAGVSFLSFVTPAVAQLRLEGLGRVYFERVAGPGEQLPLPEPVASLIPAILPEPERASTGRNGIEPDLDLQVRDFEFSPQPMEHSVWIREVRDDSHPRISTLWWALYDHGRRSDVWCFVATPARNEGKVLSNYRLDSVSMPAEEVAVLRVQGEMFRPGGAWQVDGREFVFHVGDGSITLMRVRDVFVFLHAYDTGDTAGSLSVTIEEELNCRFERREISSVTERIARTCGFRNPLLDDPWEFSWRHLEKAARCITSKPAARVTYRDFDAASFIERKNPL